MAEVVMYTADYCGYCWAARRLLAKKGVAYREIDITGDIEKRRWLRDVTGRHTVPQIFVDGTPLGGYTDVARLERAGSLDALLRGGHGGP